MDRINSESIVDLIFQLKWKSNHAIHTDCYQASRINVWRDFFPPLVLDAVKNKEAGEIIEVRPKPGDVVPKFDSKKLMQIKNTQVDRRLDAATSMRPGIGRFYPRGLLRDITGVFKANIQPFRCVEINNGSMTVDLNHPLSGRDLLLSAIVGKVETKKMERGGTSIDWIDTLTTGPGMQARWQSHQTDYFPEDAFNREDDEKDTEFYRKPRLAQHIDDTANEMVKNTYGRFLVDGMSVLDLMSSWQSHLPVHIAYRRLAGLGLNENELKKNPQLSDFLIHDLNIDPILPFESNSFDLVTCTVSVEYLTRPTAVFTEVSRVLRPGGYFIVTFSNRWFPTKAVKIWREVHEFERMGLVLEYFIRSGGFKNLQTYSIRGLPRPHDDKYFPDLLFSDPIFAVWGQK